jgi:molybdopterin converting factor small subunit
MEAIMLRINVCCLTISKYADSTFAIDMEGSTLKELIIKIGVSQRESLTYIVNGQRTDFGCILADGDNVSIVPQILGG